MLLVLPLRYMSSYIAELLKYVLVMLARCFYIQTPWETLVDYSVLYSDQTCKFHYHDWERALVVAL